MMVGWYAIKQEDSIDFKSYDNDDSNMIELRTVGFHELDELDDVSSSSRHDDLQTLSFTSPQLAYNPRRV